MSIPPNVAFSDAKANIIQPSPRVNESVPPERPNGSLFAPETPVMNPAVIPAPSIDASRSLHPSGVPTFASPPVPASRFRAILPAIPAIQADFIHWLNSCVPDAATGIQPVFRTNDIHAQYHTSQPGSAALHHSPTPPLTNAYTALPLSGGMSIQRDSPAALPRVMLGAGGPYGLEKHDVAGIPWQISNVNILAFQFQLLEMQIAAFGALFRLLSEPQPTFKTPQDLPGGGLGCRRHEPLPAELEAVLYTNPPQDAAAWVKWEERKEAWVHRKALNASQPSDQNKMSASHPLPGPTPPPSQSQPPTAPCEATAKVPRDPIPPSEKPTAVAPSQVRKKRRRFRGAATLGDLVPLAAGSPTVREAAAHYLASISQPSLAIGAARAAMDAAAACASEIGQWGAALGEAASFAERERMAVRQWVEIGKIASELAGEEVMKAGEALRVVEKEVGKVGRQPMWVRQLEGLGPVAAAAARAMAACAVAQALTAGAIAAKQKAVEAAREAMAAYEEGGGRKRAVAEAMEAVLKARPPGGKKKKWAEMEGMVEGLEGRVGKRVRVKTGEAERAPGGKERSEGEVVKGVPHVVAVGMRVEVCSNEEGLRGCWHSGRLRSLDGSTGQVVYDELLDEVGGKLVESVPFAHPTLPSYFAKKPSTAQLMRPAPWLEEGGERGRPRRRSEGSALHFQVGDKVDALFEDGWWEAVVRKVEGGGNRISIYYPGEDDTAVYHRQNLRRTLVFLNNCWVPAGTVPLGEAGGGGGRGGEEVGVKEGRVSNGVPGGGQRGGEASAVLAQETGGAVA